MKRTLLVAVAVTLAVALTSARAHRVVADDETADTAVQIQASLDAANCGATPPTITVLGLPVDVSSATFNMGGDTEIKIHAPLTAANCSATPPTITVLGLTIDVSAATFDAGGEGGDQGGTSGPGAASCATLVVGDNVDVHFASDSTPLAATQVDDQGSFDQELSVRGPLQTIDVTNQTVQVLGVTISAAGATAGGGGGGDNGGGGDGGSASPVDLSQLQTGQFAAVQLDAGQLPALVATGLEAQPLATCAGLVVGSTVEVELVSDGTPLLATVVNVRGSDSTEPRLQGPLQAIDATNQTVQILGLTINVATATLGGCDDNSADGNSQPVDLTQLTVGQIVAVQLDASQLPALVATGLEVKNFANQVGVEVDDSNGQPIDDTDSNGNPVNDVAVEVDETVTVTAPTPGALGIGTRHVKKVLHLHRNSNGSVTFGGLATGHAKISVIRTANGTTAVGHHSVKVKPNTRGQVRVRLHHTH